MKKYLHILFVVAALAVVFSCDSTKEQGGNSEQLKILVSQQSSMEAAEGDQLTMSYYGSGPLLTDKVVFKDTKAGTEYVFSIKSSADGKFSFTMDKPMPTGTYTIYIRRGPDEALVGPVNFTLIVRVEILPKEGYNVYGRISCGDEGVAGVVVSDGIEVTRTDANGVYYLNSSKKYNLVWYSVPGGYEPVTLGYDGSAGGILPVIYRQLDGVVANTQRADFEMVKAQDTDNYTLFIMGDMHLANRSGTGDLAQFRTFATEFNQRVSTTTGRRYGLTLGDMSWDIYWYENKFNLADYYKEMDTDVKDLIIYHTMGNHDNDFSRPDDFDKEQPYRDILAPTYYSYNIGKIHYVVLDDIDYSGVPASTKDASGKIQTDHRGEYTTNVTQDQLDWLKKDLSYVSKSTPIILSAHAPVYRPNGVNAWKAGLSGRTYGATADLASVLSGYTVHYFTGHTHKIFNYDNLSSGKFFEHNAGSVCGSWWWSGHYVSGINLAQDGAPGGYTVLSVKGTNLSWVYKSTSYPETYQFRAYDMNEVKKVVTSGKYSRTNWEKYATAMQKYGSNVILLNIWNYDPSWKISVIENGKELTVTQISEYDPLHIISESAYRDSFNTDSWVHHFKATATSATSTVTIRVTDRFGNVYSETMNRPKTFETGTYHASKY
ncbi:MAG: calcineurin-like phosphoesterase C-terminal domain-containing protein [Bacteroidales bacterium]|nr:calcineurin-like phosphoesterase C-terminal domain-containing protein [Bacteroidales bacterium]